MRSHRAHLSHCCHSRLPTRIERTDYSARPRLDVTSRRRLDLDVLLIAELAARIDRLTPIRSEPFDPMGPPATRRRFRAGDRVQVILDRILAQERKLQFSIVEEGIPLARTKAVNSLPRAKKNKRKDGATAPSKGKKRFGKKGKRR